MYTDRYLDFRFHHEKLRNTKSASNLLSSTEGKSKEMYVSDMCRGFFISYNGLLPIF